MASHSLSLPVLACNVSTEKLDLQTPCCVCLKEGRLCFVLLCFGNQKSFWSSCQQSLGHLFVLLGRVNRATVRNETLKNETDFPGDGGWAAEMSRTSIQNRHHRHQAGGKNIGFYTQLCRGTAEWTAWKPLKIAAADVAALKLSIFSKLWEVGMETKGEDCYQQIRSSEVASKSGPWTFTPDVQAWQPRVKSWNSTH